MSFGEEKVNIRNINTMDVLIFNPNDPYTSVHSERGSVTQKQKKVIDDGLRTADSDERHLLL